MLPLPTEALHKAYRGRRIAVLGASGFIGRWVARHLTACEADLCLLVRDASGLEALMPSYAIRGEIVEQNLSDLAAVANLIADLRPAAIFNLAGYGIDRAERDKATAYRINADLVRATAEAMASVQDPGWNGRGFVHVGSALEYGVATGDLAEDSEPRPTTLYGRSKLAGTRHLAKVSRQRRLDGVTARLFTVYGPGEHPNRLVPSLLRTARTGEPLALTEGRQQRDFTFVADAAEALLRLGMAPGELGEVVNVATGHLTSVRAFTETAAHVFGIEEERLQFGAVPTRVEEMEHLPVAVERLRARTGWLPPTGLEDGLQRTQTFVHGRPSR